MVSMSEFRKVVDSIAYGLGAIFALDRSLKLASIIHFFQRKQPPLPPSWPTISLIQPVTRGVSGLATSLRSRALLDYPAPIEHLIVCDADDKASQAICQTFLKEFPSLQAKIILVTGQTGEIATKTEKMQAALNHASGDILWFLDDDIALRHDAFVLTIPSLLQPDAGAIFGIACYTNWQNLWSSAMSVFVNSNALMSYIPLTYLTEPYTVTGHCFALRRSVFEQVGGLDGLNNRIDDDHEIARRVRRAGYKAVQTPMIYDADNYLADWRSYHKQMKRWFIIPRQTMVPYLTLKEKILSSLGGIGIFLLPLLALLALITRRRSTGLAFWGSLGLFSAIYALSEKYYIRRLTPVRYWWLVPVLGILSPLHMLWTFLVKPEIEWRGQRIYVHRSGEMEVSDKTCVKK